MVKNGSLELVKRRLGESAATLRDLALDSDALNQIAQIAGLVVDALKNKKRVLIFGNGGSAADAQHFAAELVGGYTNHNRPPLDVLALSTNTSNLTAIGNDYAYEDVFSRQVQAHARSGDVVIGISTSGNSANVLKALEAAKKLGAVSVGLTGTPGGGLAKGADFVFHAPSGLTPRIQEAHIAAIHAICEIVERELFPGKQ